MSRDTEILEVARRQHALFTRRQALAAGFTSRMIDGRLALGLWERVHARLYRLAGAPVTHEQKILAALLSCGDDAVASHRSAAWLWGLDGPFGDVVEIAMPRGRATDLEGVVSHRSSDLSPKDVTVRRGIRVTKPARTLVDLGAVCSTHVVNRAISSVLPTRLTTLEGLWWMLARVSRRGRAGAGVLRQCLEWRFGVPDSVLEDLFLKLVHDQGLPTPVVQYEVVASGRRRRIDAAYPDRLLAIELDGAAHRMSPESLQEDDMRQNEIAAELGFRFLRFTFLDLTQRKPVVVRQVRQMYDGVPVLEQETHR